MSTPYDLPSDPRLPFVKIFSPILPCIPKGPADRRDLEASKSHVEYPCIPLKSVIQLRSMLSEMQVCLSRISVPAIIIHSRQDKGIGLENAEKIYSSIKSTDKTLVIVENSGHDIPREPDREFVFKTTGDFIQRVTN
jgi:carboxylesterase